MRAVFWFFLSGNLNFTQFVQQFVFFLSLLLADFKNLCFVSSLPRCPFKSRCTQVWWRWWSEGGGEESRLERHNLVGNQ